MAKQVKVGRNEECPCGSRVKLKRCCALRGVDWNVLLRERAPKMLTELSIRGRNLAFLHHAADALQLDHTDRIDDWRIVKRACTPAAVRKIHEALEGFWPNEEDYYSVLAREKNVESGLYVGSYEPEHILEGISRHSIYSDSVILFNPFMDPRVIKPEFNPLVHPEKYRTATLKNLYLWFSLAPWIEAGLVRFVPKPTDFDAALARETARAQHEKFQSNPALMKALDENEDTIERFSRSFKSFALLHTADDQLIDAYLKANPQASSGDVADLLEEIKEAREEHPYFIEGSLGSGKGQGEITSTTSGASFPIAKMVATLTGAHLITDLAPKWQEIELDRKESGVEVGKWTPFAKAFHNAKLPYLNEVSLKAALTLRREDRLQSMRAFLGKVWKATKSLNEFDDSNASELAEELVVKVHEAEKEWNQIDRDLLAWAGGGGVASAVAVATGNSFLAAAPFVAASVTQLLVARSKRRDFARCQPAAFFLNLRKSSGSGPS